MSVQIVNPKHAFPLPLDLRNLANGHKDHWVTLAPFAYRDVLDEMLYIVPAGFSNDSASVPRMFWPAIDPCNDVAYAATVHDWLYATRGFVRPYLPLVSRAKADALFYRALRANGVGFFQAQAMWSAVRIGGGSAWRTGASAAHLFHAHVEPATLQMIAEVEAADEPGPEVTA